MKFKYCLLHKSRKNKGNSSRSSFNLLVVFVLTYAFIVVQWFVFTKSVGIFYPNVVGTILKAFGDTAIILIPYFLLNGYWRWYAVFIQASVSLFFLSNAMYFRFWEDLVPSSVYTTTANFDTSLLEYAGGLFKLSDIFCIVFPLILIAVFLFLKPYKNPPLSGKSKVFAVFISFLLFCAGQFSYVKSSWQTNKEATGLSGINLIGQHYFGNKAKYISDYYKKGLPVYFFSYVVEILKTKLGRKHLTPEETEEISSHLRKISSLNHEIGPETSRNIIFIIVESLNADAIGMKIDDFKVTPALDSLVNLPGSISFSRVVSQTKNGDSTDGQMILLTGLLPINSGAAAISFSDAEYPSLPRLLPKHHSEVFLADDGVVWNQEGALKNYGFEKVHTINDFKTQAEIRGKDRALFDYFAQKMDSIPQPFFATLITMSMHFPFHEDAMTMPQPIENIPDISENNRNYLKSLHYFDETLKDFLTKVPENTLVIIASDHSQNIVKLNDTSYAGYLALHTGLSRKVDRIVGQSALFPVSLMLTGSSRSSYNGITKSALDESVRGAIDGFEDSFGFLSPEKKDSLLHEFFISDLIIRGNYFKSHQLQ